MLAAWIRHAGRTVFSFAGDETSVDSINVLKIVADELVTPWYVPGSLV